MYWEEITDAIKALENKPYINDLYESWVNFKTVILHATKEVCEKSKARIEEETDLLVE